MNFGTISIFSLPMIGMFDMKLFPLTHRLFAGIFFGSFGVYCLLLAKALYSNKDKFPESDHFGIGIIQKSSQALFITLIAFGISYVKYGLAGPTPYIEWFVVIFNMNFFSIASFTNQFYDSINDAMKEEVEACV